MTRQALIDAEQTLATIEYGRRSLRHHGHRLHGAHQRQYEAAAQAAGRLGVDVPTITRFGDGLGRARRALSTAKAIARRDLVQAT